MEVSSLTFTSEDLWKIYMSFLDTQTEYKSMCNVSDSQLKYLKSIASDEGVSLSELARLTNNSKPTVSEMVNKLIDLNLAYKERCKKDNRRAYIHLTDEGLECLHNDYLGLKLKITHLLNQMDEEDVETIIRILKKYNL
jgi:DNA-binding MarR family transcriptional regulator